MNAAVEKKIIENPTPFIIFFIIFILCLGFLFFNIFVYKEDKNKDKK